MPLRIGDVYGIPWAIAEGGPEIAPIINGYARIPWEGHPWTGCTDYEELPVEVHGGLTYGPTPERDLQKTIDELENITTGTDHPFRSNLDHDIAVRPAVTFADVGGWIGFDTAHAWDYWSEEELARYGVKENLSLPASYRALFRTPRKDSIYWTGQKVMAEARKLAMQILAAQQEGNDHRHARQ